MDPPKSAFWFLKKTQKKKNFFGFRLWFSFKNNRLTNVLLVGIFENAKKKVIDCQKRHFGRFWQLITVFFGVLKILIKITFVCILFYKLKQKKKNWKQIGWPSKKGIFKFWNKNRNKNFFIFFFCLSFKNNRHTNVIWSLFLKTHRKTVINRQKRLKWCFWQSITFFCTLSKIQIKRAFVRLLFLKLNQSWNTKTKFFWVGFLQKPKTHFFGGPKWYFLKVKFQICISAFVL